MSPRTRALVVIALLASLPPGCLQRPDGPQRGGIATIGRALVAPFKPMADAIPLPAGRPAKPLQAPAEGEGMTITQPDNPAHASAQTLDYTREEEITLAADTVLVTESEGVRQTLEVPAGSHRVVRESRKAGQTIGAAQKDTARETAAWLGSFRWVQGLGVLVLLAGVAGFAHPAARVLIGGKDTAMVVGLCGIGMIVGPFLLVKYANWLAALLLVAAAHWFLSRAKYKEGRLDELERVSRPPFPPG